MEEQDNNGSTEIADPYGKAVHNVKTQIEDLAVFALKAVNLIHNVPKNYDQTMN